MTELSIEVFAEQCRRWKVPGFLRLAELLGNDIAAAKAMRAETAFVQTPEWLALGAPRDLDFAKKVRTFLIEQKLEWNNGNLLKACKHVLGQTQ